MKVLFVVGPHASGKTYSIKKCVSESNEKFSIIDTGPMMREFHKNSMSDLTIGEWVQELEEIFGKSITSKMITDEVKRRVDIEQNENVIIIGYRTIDSIKYLVDNMGIEEFKVLYVDAPISLLFNNYCEREGNKKTFNEFEYYINEEERSGLVKLKAYAMCGCEKFEYFYKKSNVETFDNSIKEFFQKGIRKELKYNE